MAREPAVPAAFPMYSPRYWLSGRANCFFQTSRAISRPSYPPTAEFADAQSATSATASAICGEVVFTAVAIAARCEEWVSRFAADTLCCRRSLSILPMAREARRSASRLVGSVYSSLEGNVSRVVPEGEDGFAPALSVPFTAALVPGSFGARGTLIGTGTGRSPGQPLPSCRYHQR